MPHLLNASITPGYVVPKIGGEPAALSSHSTVELPTATPSNRKSHLLPLERTFFASPALPSYPRGWFGGILSTVLFLVALYLYLAAQAILAPLYTPFVIKVSRKLRLRDLG